MPDIPETPAQLCRDGLSYQTESTLKESLRDPDSYVRQGLSITPATDRGPDAVLVTIDYRAKNGFGGYDSGEAQVIVDLKKCSLIEAIRAS